MDVVTALEASYDQTAKLVATLSPAQLDAQSPCSDWDTRAMLNHLLGATWMFTLVNQGQAAGEDAGDVIAGDPALAVATAARENLASWRRPGVFTGDKTYPFGTFPAAAAAMINLEEVVVHNWDLAQVLAVDPMIDSDVAQMVYDFFAALPLEEFRAHGAFGPEVMVPASAPITDRLMGLLGRQP